MGWRLINPAILTFLVSLSGVFLAVTLLIVVMYEEQAKSDIVEFYTAIIKVLFHPTSLPRLRGEPAFSTITYIIGGFWFIGYLASAQPYINWMRILGSIVGILSTFIWVAYSFIIFVLSSVS